MSYNYRETVREDIKDYLLVNFGVAINYYYDLGCEDLDEFKEKVIEDMRENDGITGSQFGYEGLDREGYIKAVVDNWDLLSEAIDDLGFYFEESDYDSWYNDLFVEKDWSRLDCYIRDYMVGQEAEEIIDELYSNGEIKISVDEDPSASGNVELSDEEYDEGFDESVNKHKRRIRY